MMYDLSTNLSIILKEPYINSGNMQIIESVNSVKKMWVEYYLIRYWPNVDRQSCP